MKITVHAKPNAGIEKVEPQADGSFKVWVKARPHDGQANAAILKLLARHFGIPPSRAHLLSGHTSRIKIIEIDD